MMRILIANRAEVAQRIADAAVQLGIETVSIFTSSESIKEKGRADEVGIELSGDGPSAYLDIEDIVSKALASGADAIHPGYGFLAESADFAAAVIGAGLAFIGPSPQVLELFGDKPRSKRFASDLGVPTPDATEITAEVSASEVVEDLLAAAPAGAQLILKAANGGGGRGIRRLSDLATIEDQLRAVRSEVASGFGDGGLYIERMVNQARHIEVQIAADVNSEVICLGTRDCSVQRRSQKVIEIAPAQGLSPELELELQRHSIAMTKASGLVGLATFEFLVSEDEEGTQSCLFIEVNPRLQVEHGVTEEVFGLDLVVAQIGLAQGLSLVELGLDPADPPKGRGVAVEARVTAEHLSSEGTIVAAAGTISELHIPCGSGVRVDSVAREGLAIDGRFDPLLAKVITHSSASGFRGAVALLSRALGRLLIGGVQTNVELLLLILEDPAFVGGRFFTTTLEESLERDRDRFKHLHSGDSSGVGVDSGEIRSEMPATVVSVAVRPGDVMAAGAELLVLESMKMHHAITTSYPLEVLEVPIDKGRSVGSGDLLVVVRRLVDEGGSDDQVSADETNGIRPDLAELMERLSLIADEQRRSDTERRHLVGRLTARECIDLLCDRGSFVEFGGLAIASQRQRRSIDDLIRRTPADGLIGGVARVNSDLFEPNDSSAIVVSYDYTVLAGTQGYQGHRKKDRLFELADRLKLPVVLFAEGGGGRPGDTDTYVITGLETMAFSLFARLSGVVPLVGVVSGRCFAGNAALLGICDVIISTRESNIGMGGPAMIEGGGLGRFLPEEIGPSAVQYENGVIDVLVEDDAQAVGVAKRYLSYFQGAVSEFSSPDQVVMRRLVPEDRLRSYDVRAVIDTLSDVGWCMELRAGYGPGMVTSLIRLGGRPVGVVANNPRHLGGAIDATAADKAARFTKMCNSFGVPIVFLCDTPGFMVGPKAEESAQVRRFAQMFIAGASLKVPFFTVALRKGYGLGAQAMAGGSFRSPIFTVSWPTGEFGGMGLEGAVRLGYRKELEAATSEAERKELFDRLVTAAYRNSKALSIAENFEIDDVIDPAETRDRILKVLESIPLKSSGIGAGRGSVDPW